MDGHIFHVDIHSLIDALRHFEQAGWIPSFESMNLDHRIRMIPGEHVPENRFDSRYVHVVMSDQRMADFSAKVKEFMSIRGDGMCDLVLDTAWDKFRETFPARDDGARKITKESREALLLPEIYEIIEAGRDEYVRPAGPSIARFRLDSGTMVASDPCYSKDTWCAEWGLKARPGEWNAICWKKNEPFLGRDNHLDIRCAMLEIAHADFPVDNADIPWEKVDAHIGVDSGQAGFFDAEKYRGGEDEQWYEACSFSLLPGDRNGLLRVVDGGAICDSGHGDGGYPLYVKRDGDEIIRAAIVFFSVETDEECGRNDEDEDDDDGYTSYPVDVRRTCYGG